MYPFCWEEFKFLTCAFGLNFYLWREHLLLVFSLFSCALIQRQWDCVSDTSTKLCRLPFGVPVMDVQVR